MTAFRIHAVAPYAVVAPMSKAFASRLGERCPSRLRHLRCRYIGVDYLIQAGSRRYADGSSAGG